MAFHPIALGGHYVLWRSALQERVDVVERSRNAAARKLEPLNRNRAAPKHEIMARLQKARNGVNYFVCGVMCLIEVNCLFRRRHLRDVDDLLVQNRFGGHLRDMFPQLGGKIGCRRCLLLWMLVWPVAACHLTHSHAHSFAPRSGDSEEEDSCRYVNGANTNLFKIVRPPAMGGLLFVDFSGYSPAFRTASFASPATL
jgi:hypothetical protein